MLPRANHQRGRQVIPEAAVYTGAHSPYVVTSTGQLFCYADGCDWTSTESGDTAIQSWNDHHKDKP